MTKETFERLMAVVQATIELNIERDARRDYSYELNEVEELTRSFLEHINVETER